MPEGADVAAIVEHSPQQVLDRDDRRARTGSSPVCAAIKAAVVAADPLERTGLRASLNYGHTLAHALETAGRYDLHHGEAVAIGLVFAGQLAERARADRPRRSSTATTISSPSLGLAGRGARRRGVGNGAARRSCGATRRRTAGSRSCCPGPTGLETVDDPPASALETALRAVGVEG